MNRIAEVRPESRVNTTHVAIALVVVAVIGGLAIASFGGVYCARARGQSHWAFSWKAPILAGMEPVNRIGKILLMTGGSAVVVGLCGGSALSRYT